MKIVAFIFARGGSKGLPRKNLMMLGELPLLAWSIKVARKVKRIDRVIVSTDDEEIAKVALQYGAEVPFMRPKELANDDTPEWLAWRHALDYLRLEENYLPNIMVSLPATSPLRSHEDVDDCIDLFLSEHIDGVITVNESSKNPYFNMISRDTNGLSRVVCSGSSTIFRRQDAPHVFEMNTVCFVVNPSFVHCSSSLMSGKIKSVVIPRERSVDIDDIYDFQMAELLLLRKCSPSKI